MASQERIPYMTLYAKYRNTASLRGAAVLGDDDLMKRYVKWYSSVLSNEQLKDIVNENNDELDDEDDAAWISGVPSLPASRTALLGDLVTTDLLSPVVPYAVASEVSSLVHLRRTLRIGGRINEADSAAELVKAIEQELTGPMIGPDDFPEDSKEREVRTTEQVFDFAEYLDGVGSHKRGRDGGAEGTEEDGPSCMSASCA